MRDSIGTFKIEVINRPEEVAEAGWLFERESALVLPVVLNVILPAIGAFFICYALPSSGYYGPEQQLISFFCCWIAGAFAFSGCVTDKKKQVLERYRRSALATAKIKYNVSNDGLQIFIRGNTELVVWSRFSQCLNFPSSITLVLGRELYLLPKRSFDSAESVRKVLRMIIAGGVSFSNRGKPLEKIVYEGVDPELADKLPSMVFAAESRDIAAELVEELKIYELEAEDIEIVGPLPDLGTFRISAPHPQSNLFTEPLAGRTYKTFVEVHCVYKFQELLKIDRRLYWRYGFRPLALVHLYIVLLLWGLIAMIYLLAGLNYTIFSLVMTGIFLAITVATVAQHLDQRADQIVDLLDNRQPVILEISEHLCVIRDRNGVLNLPWAAFFMCATTSDFYICPWSAGAMIIPRKAVKDNQSEDLKMLLTQNIAKHESW